MNYVTTRLFLRISLAIALFFFSDLAYCQNNDQKRERLLIDSNWKFLPGDPENAEQASFNDGTWRLMNLPHDWSIEGKYNENEPTGGSGGYLPTGIGWYRKHIKISKNDLQKNIRIEFDGVYMNSDVWLNGHHLGNYPYGYSSFYYDLNEYLVEGENIISVRVDNSLQPNTRWYTGSGIYRHVWLVLTDPLHIAHWGVYVTTPEVSEKSALVDIKTKIENNDQMLKDGVLLSFLIDKDGKEAGKAETKFSLEPGTTSELSQQIKVNSPVLWSVESPVMYRLYSVIYKESKTIDEVNINVGIRKIEFDKDKGFFLNGKHVKMNGVCLHHDGGPVGAAVPERIWERRLEKLKLMGCNAIRTSHNPPAPEFLDLCDRMGFLVMDEPFDEWKYGKRKYGYHQYFDEWSQKDLTAMLHRDRNHPSIVLWSAGNEIPEQKDEDGINLLKPLIETFHREDPTRPVTLALDNIAADGGSTALNFMEALDIVGYNYVDRWHERRELFYGIDRHAHPDWKMTGTESGSNSGVIRGNYSLGDDPSVVKPNYNFDMIDAEQLWKFVSIHDYVMGDFMWTGIDYLGEAPWPNRSGNFGVMDLCGFEKDGYYFYQSQWTKEPMIHLFPHWNWKGREGQVIPVLCYTNCDAVELFLNGKSFGEKRIEFPRQGTSGGWNSYEKPRVLPTTSDLHLQWDVPYEPGVLKAIGKKDGKVVFTVEIKTSGLPAALKLTIDRNSIDADGQDIAHVEVQVVDSAGNIVPTSDNLIKFSIEGEGKLIGVDNGNPLDHDSYKINQRKAFNGLCLGIVQSSGSSGKIKVAVYSEGLKEAVLELEGVTK